MRAPFIPKLSPGDRNPSDEQHAKRGGNAVEKRGTFFSNHTKKFQTWLVEKLGMCGSLLTDDEVRDGEGEEEVVGDGLQLLVYLERYHHLE